MKFTTIGLARLFAMTSWGLVTATTLLSGCASSDDSRVALGTVELPLVATATSSSDQSSGLAAQYAVDGDLSTRWSSDWSDPQWILLDLGSSQSFDRVVLHWETAYSSHYEIQVSDDAANWTTLYVDSNGDGGVDDIAVTGTGRYVRMYSYARGTGWGNSLWEFEVLDSAPPPPECTSGTDCDDGNVCTDDSCNAGSCSHTNNANGCDDGNACTSGDVCSSGSCSGVNQCTGEQLLPLTRTADSGGWSNIDAVTDGDPATAGNKAGTTEWIEYSLGSSTTLTRARLREDNAGSWNVETWKLQYWTGSAWADAFPYTDTPTGAWNDVDTNDVATDRIRLYVQDTAHVEVQELEVYGDASAPPPPPPAECSSNADCNDGDVCTDDTCNSGSCSHSNNAASCDDGNACTTGDTCSAGVCAGTNTCTTETEMALTQTADSGGWNNVAYASDGDTSTSADKAGTTEWIEFSLPSTATLTRARLHQDNAGSWNVETWKVQYWTGSTWADAFPYTDTPVADWNEVDFPDVATDRVRLYVQAATHVELQEFEVFGFSDSTSPPPPPPPPSSTFFGDYFDTFDSNVWGCEFTCPTVSGGIAQFLLQAGIQPNNVGSWSKIGYKPTRFTSGTFTVRFALTQRPTNRAVWWGVALWDGGPNHDESQFNEINFGYTTDQSFGNSELRFESAKLGNDVSLRVDTGVDLYDGSYHTERLEYDSTHVAFYFDDQLLEVITDPDVIPTDPMEFIIGPRLVTGSAPLESDFSEFADWVEIEW